MNFDICKKCKNYPEFFTFHHKSKTELVFFGKQKMKKISPRMRKKYKYMLTCAVAHKGFVMDGYLIEKIKPKTLLMRNDIYPLWRLCPYYMEQKLSEWNKEK